MSPSAARLRASPLFWPLPPAFVLVPAGLILAMTLAGTWDQFGWRALDWVYLCAQVGAQARLPVVVAAGAAALVAGRFTRRSLVFAQPWQPRADRDVPLRHAAVVVGWCLGAYLAGMLPLTFVTAAQGSGTPDAVAVAGALTGFVALTLLGYLCGVLARGLLAVPVAVGTVFLLTSLVFVSDSWTALSLQLPFDPFLGRREAAALGPYRLGFFLLLTVAVAWTVAWLLRAPRRFSAVHGAAVAAVAVTVVLPHLHPFPLVVRAPGPAVCEEHGGVRYCVHEGHAEELAAITALAAPVFDAYGLTDALPRQVRDQSLARGDEEVFDGPARGVLWLPVHPGWDPYQQVPAFAAEWLAPDVLRCGSEGVVSLDRNAEPQERRAAVVHGLKAWLASQAFGGGAHGDTLFADAAPDRVRAWIRQDRERLASCEVDPEELPWRT
ncbi:hypothetical protein A6A08_03020 [Nocardiopsis sp. TSRI0078]|uniref:hypothetical protein n=1 Tax=unclassified Nocardiopsis TaxID=2649073 RepID=UPI0009397745|nr:hypothetical protein [Nocardiopsis sp. TSRI0078]OKI23751.1 hypothetical protein A6A08_03020 [Nocardiopsis sp. TSRI0078]